jgi:hypothetical protein
MNFFGHAVVSSRRRREHGFVLGSMLPDFATMLRRRPPATAHPELELGVLFHHETDAVFHSAPTFVALSGKAFQQLTSMGLARGPARAVAHVGVELLLDAVLAHDGEAVSAYRQALGAAHPDALGSALSWREADAPARFEELRVVLCSREPTRTRVAPQLFAARLERALAARPRLMLDANGKRLVEQWCDETQDSIVEHAERLIEEVNHGLTRRM